MFLTGAGGSKAAMERIKAGGLYRATFLYNPSMSSSAINLARLIAQGSGMQDLAEPEVPTKITVAATTVTKDNVDEVSRISATRSDHVRRAPAAPGGLFPASGPGRRRVCRRRGRRRHDAEGRARRPQRVAVPPRPRRASPTRARRRCWRRSLASSTISSRRDAPPWRTRPRRHRVAIPGPVDEGRGIVLNAPNLGWQDVPLREMAVERTGLQVFVCHDVRAAAHGGRARQRPRQRRPRLRRHRHGRRIGGRDRRQALRRGPRHRRRDGTHDRRPHRPVLRVRRARAPRGIRVGRRDAEALRGGERRRADRDRRPGGRAVAGDEPARQIWDQAIDALAISIADAVVLLDPQRIVIGGGVAAAGTTCSSR